MSRPDALMVSDCFKRGADIFEKKKHFTELVDPLLQIDRTEGERWYAHQQPFQKSFVTRDHFDTILFPKNGPMAGKPRYRWESRPDGIEVGYLVEEAKA